MVTPVESSLCVTDRLPECPVPEVRYQSRRPWRRRAASSSPRAALLRHGSCVLARHPPVTPLGGTDFPKRNTRRASIVLSLADNFLAGSLLSLLLPVCLLIAIAVWY